MKFLKILWLLLVPLTIIGASYCAYRFIDSVNYIIPIFLGLCIVLNLPMSIAAYNEDDNPNLTAYVVWVVFLAPFWLVWLWIITVIHLKD